MQDVSVYDTDKQDNAVNAQNVGATAGKTEAYLVTTDLALHLCANDCRDEAVNPSPHCHRHDA